MAKIPFRRNRMEQEALAPAVRFARKDPKLASVITKLEAPKVKPPHDNDGNIKPSITNYHIIRSILSKRAQRNQDIANIMKMLPDVELSVQILTSSILSPKDMTSSELLYETPRNVFSPELTASVLAVIKESLENDYKLKDLLPVMIREAMFEKGAYPIAVIPENVVDAIINGATSLSTESIAELRRVFRKDGTAYPIGILGGVSKEENESFGPTLESYRNPAHTQIQDDNTFYYLTYAAETIHDNQARETKIDQLVDTNIAITDNPVVLRVHALNQISRARAVHEAYNKGAYRVGLEDRSDERISDYMVEKGVYRARRAVGDTVAVARHQNELARRSVGAPLLMKFPSEAVLPVHVPGSPEQHVGYYILLDQEGYPLEQADGDQLHQTAASMQKTQLTSNLLKKAAINLGVNEAQLDPSNQAHVRELTRMYSEMVEKDLIARIRNGAHGANVTIARNEEIYRLMLARTLANRRTQLLYLPIEYMTYIAFKYNDDGIGRSMLDDQSMLLTIRSVLLFVDVLAAVKNSIGRTKVTAKLDPSDPNPRKTIEMLQEEFIRGRTTTIPLGVSSPYDIYDMVGRAGLIWNFEGHPAVPDMGIDFENIGSDIRRPDSDLKEDLRKQSIMGFGLSPETVDNGFNTEFATTATHNNVLLAKRVITWQDILTPKVTDVARKLILHTEDTIDSIKSLLMAQYEDIALRFEDDEAKRLANLSEEAKKKILVNRALHEFLRGFHVRLPRPNNTTTQQQSDDLKAQSDLLDEALRAHLPSELFSQSLMGDLAEGGSDLIAVIKAYFMRKMMVEKNILPELSELTAIGEDGKPITDVGKEIVNYATEISKLGTKLFIQMKSTVDAVNKDLAVAQAAPSGSGVSDYGDASSSSTDDEDDLGGFGGFGDADLNPDLGGADDTTAETTQEEPEAQTDQTEGNATQGEQNKPAEN